MTLKCITIPPGLLRTGDNRRLRGEDLAQGKPALQKGEQLTPAATWTGGVFGP